MPIRPFKPERKLVMVLNLNNKFLLQNKALIDNKWVDAQSGKTFAVTNPANGNVITDVAECGTTETAQAIEKAHQALSDWQNKTAKERAKHLKDWYSLIIENKDDLAEILTAEQGKPLAESLGEIIYGANYIEWFAEEAKRIYGDTIAPPSNDKRLVCIKQPVGVVACITPWNFPNAMLTRKIAPALAAGCTVVCKPANETPLSALALAELALRAGIPAGVINMVNGITKDIGAELTSNPLVKKVTFTGSTPVGKMLMSACAETVKRTSMELGGNAPFIVFDDANIDEAVNGAMISKFRNAGQTCVCANRILVQEGIYDKFAEKLKIAVAKLKMGTGTQDNVTIGPLIHEKAADNVRALIQNAVDDGAEIMTGKNPSDHGPNFINPTILTNVNKNMRIFNEEIFGPVAPLFKFKTEEEAIQLANDTPFGLASYFYSRDIGRVWRVSEQLEYGIVGVNDGMISNEMAPFGGVKESGQGREGSKYGLDDYLEIKYICMGGI